jgi:hypothetical protein
MKGMTLADVQAHNRKVAEWLKWPNLHEEPAKAPTARPEYIPYAQKRKGMNKLETAYSALLEAQKACGEIEWWAFEPFRLKLADSTYYRPDFGVLRKGQLEFHETKGFMREAARVRLNVAAAHLPFPFYLVRQEKGEWRISRV